MIRKEYTLSFDKAEKSERTIREFFLKNADIVRFTHRPVSKIGKNIFIVIGSKGPVDKQNKVVSGKDDSVFIKLLRELRKDFIKKITNDKLFNDIRQKGELFDHYFYKISASMKRKLNKNSLFKASFRKGIHYYMKNFPCFEDPTFYKKGKMIGSVITHEPIIILYLIATEKSALEKNGAFFD